MGVMAPISLKYVQAEHTVSLLVLCECGEMVCVDHDNSHDMTVK